MVTGRDMMKAAEKQTTKRTYCLAGHQGDFLRSPSAPHFQMPGKEPHFYCAAVRDYCVGDAEPRSAAGWDRGRCAEALMGLRSGPPRRLRRTKPMIPLRAQTRLQLAVG